MEENPVVPTRFADIPKPKFVEKLPATSSGMPVPFTTLYLPEDRADPTYFEPHPNRAANRDALKQALSKLPSNMRAEARDLVSDGVANSSSNAVILHCSCEFGVGRPQFGKPCVYRQRKAMRQRRCVVCGRQISTKARAVFLGVTWFPDAEDRSRVLTSMEPPAHAACAAYSALTCRRLAEKPGEVRVATVHNYQVWQRVVRRFGKGGTPVGPLQPLSTPVTTGGVDLYFAMLDRGVTHTTLDTWLAEHAPAPYRGMSAMEFA